MARIIPGAGNKRPDRVRPVRRYRRIPAVADSSEEQTLIESGEIPCPNCEGGGWMQVYSPCPPAFEMCTVCYNPHNVPCP